MTAQRYIVCCHAREIASPQKTLDIILTAHSCIVCCHAREIASPQQTLDISPSLSTTGAFRDKRKGSGQTDNHISRILWDVSFVFCRHVTSGASHIFQFCQTCAIEAS